MATRRRPTKQTARHSTPSKPAGHRKPRAVSSKRKPPKPAKHTDRVATEKLFLKAYRYNWDNGMRGLYKILDHEACDRATALLIYWMGKPAFYNELPSDAAAPESSKRELELVRTIERRIRAKQYPSLLAFAPATSAITAAVVPAVRGRIPPEMYEPCKGEISADSLVDASSVEQRMLAGCRRGDVAEIIACCDAGWSATKPLEGHPPLAYAVFSGKADAVRYLLENGADANKRSGPDRSTPLHGAVGHIEAFTALLEHGGDIEGTDRWGRTPLHSTAYVPPEMWSSDMDQFLRFLLARGANPRAKDEDGKTPLDLASAIRNTAAVEILRAAKR